MSAYILVMLGGASGALGRYLLGQWFMCLYPKPAIPYAMIIVNGLGSAGLGFLVGSTLETQEPVLMTHEPFALLWSVGFLGAFTTFSTFSVEALQLWQEGRVRAAITYVGLTLFVTILGFNLSLLLAANLL